MESLDSSAWSVVSDQLSEGFPQFESTPTAIRQDFMRPLPSGVGKGNEVFNAARFTGVAYVAAAIKRGCQAVPGAQWQTLFT